MHQIETDDHLHLRQTVIHLANNLLTKGLVVRTWGNFSVRCDEKTFFITPSGRSYEGMKPDELVRVSIDDGKALSGSKYKPSSEAPMHALAYRHRPDIYYVLHTHQVFASALSLSPNDLIVNEAQAKTLQSQLIPIATYGLPGTKKLHHHVDLAISSCDSNVFLMSRHGALILADSIESGLARAEALEEIARSLYISLVEREPSERSMSFACSPNEMKEASELRKQNSDIKSLFKDENETFVVSEDSEVQALMTRTLKPYLDDFAQICGVQVSHHRKRADVVFDRSRKIAICFGRDEQDAKNVRAVLEKNARAAHVAYYYDQRSINVIESLLMRMIYKKKYSKKAT